MDVFDLVAKITMDSSEYVKGLTDASGMASKFTSGLGTLVKGATALTGAVTAVGGAFVAGAVSTSDYGSEVNDMSKKIGMSTQAYQQWNYVMKLNGTSVEGLKMGMKTLSAQAESGSDAFQKLGISQQEVASMNQEELFSRVVDGLSGMEAGTERTTLATQLLGRTGADLGAMLDEGTDKINEEKQAALDLGMVMSDEAVAAADDFGDSLDTVKMALTGVKNMAMSDFLPSMTTVMQGFTALLSGDSGGMQMITDGINGFMQKITEVAPTILQVGGQILGNLVMGIVTQLPSLIDTAVTVIQTLVQDIIDNAPQIINAVIAIMMALVNGIITLLPTIIEAGIQLLLALIQGLIQAIPQLIAMLPTIISTIITTLIQNLPAIIVAGIQLLVALINGLVQAIPQLIAMLPTIIKTIITTLIENLPAIIEAGIQLLVAIITGLITAIPQLIAAIPQIIEAIFDAFTSVDWGQIGSDIMTGIGNALGNLGSMALNWGGDIIDNLVNGIKQQAQNLWNCVTDIAGGIADFLGFSEPKKGPLSRFHTFAPDMMDLFAKGVADNEDTVTGQIAKSFDFSDSMTAPTGLSGSSTGGGIVINVNIPEGMDAVAVGREIKNQLIDAMGSEDAVYA